MRQIIKLFFLSTYSVIILSCNTTNTQKKFEFYYYPAKNVYYDVTNSLYLYSLDGGTTWDSLSVTSDKEPSTLGTKRILYSTSLDIWKDNNQHINEYGGHAININQNDSSSLQTNLVADRKIKKARVTSTPTNVPKPEKKPGFFKRLFGKKN